MIDKIEVAKFLLSEIEAEKELFRQYNDAYELAHKKAEKNGGYYWNYLGYEKRTPSKARIRENCKKIRQLMLDISKQ